MQPISDTDLILNADGSVYHLNLLSGEIADTIITVGDQERVSAISKYFDYIEVKKAKREFVTHTGYFRGKRLTVISTGIGTDNIDIVLNELDALVNIDLKSRVAFPALRSLNVIRIGTSGAIQGDIAVDSLLISSAAFGLDPLMHYYQQNLIESEQMFVTDLRSALTAKYQLNPYLASADKSLLNMLGEGFIQGITLTAPGFYAPQGRHLRTVPAMPGFMQTIHDFRSGNMKISNLEMETAGIYGLAAALGHKALSFNVILANRASGTFSAKPLAIMDHFIKIILEKIRNAPI